MRHRNLPVTIGIGLDHGDDLGIDSNVSLNLLNVMGNGL
jgi:hypothetical protein